MAITQDASTPAIVNQSHGTAATVTTASFSPPANSLIVIICNWEYTSTSSTYTPSSTGTALTWANPVTKTQSGFLTTNIWTAWNASAQSGITVTVTAAAGSAGAAQLQVLVLNGCASSQTAPGTATWGSTSSTAEDAAITTTVTGSYVVAGANGIGTGTWTSVGMTQLGTTLTDSTADNSCIAGISTSATGTPGTTTLGWTISPACYTCGGLLEILPASGTSANAGLAAGTGTALQGGGQNIQKAAGTGTAPQPSVSSSTAVTAFAGLATGTAAALISLGLSATAALSGEGDLNAASAVIVSLSPALSGTGSLTVAAVVTPGPGTAVGVYRGPCGIYAQNGVTGGGAQSGITAYQAWLGKSVTYVLDYITSTPSSTTQFTGAYLYKPSGSYTNLNQWGALPGSQVMMLGIPACIGASAGAGAVTWAGEAAGNSDAYWTALGNNLVSWGYGNAVLRIGREFNYPGYNWSPSTTGDTPAQYIAGYQHIVTLLRGLTGADFTFMWNPALSPGTMSGQAGANAETQRWYPGNAYVDHIGLDVYDWGNYPQQTASPWGNRTLAQQQSNWSYLQTAQDGLNSWQSFAFNQGKYLSLPEWGLQLWLSGGSYYGGGDDSYYIQQVYSLLPALFMEAMWEDLGQGLFDTDADASRTAGMQPPDASRTLFLLLFGTAGVTLSGTGSLSALPQVTWKAASTLSGTGTIFVLATGGLVFGSSISTPYSYPMSSQVLVAPPGTSAWVPLGSIGVMTALTYSFTCPGGADQMTATLMVPAAYRTQLFDPGWQVRITRGGHQVWDGKLDEPVPTSSGWNLTASGTGNRGQDFLAVYTDTWPVNQPDESINTAIARGMSWVNPGVGTPSGAWFGQEVDPGAQTITALLNLVCTRGALTWYVNSQPGGIIGDDLNVFPLPTVPNRLLSSVNPAPRTLGGDINTIWLRYEISADGTDSSGNSVAAVYGTTSVQNTASVTAHGVMETYIDLSDTGVMTLAAAQAVGNNVLAIYQRASFAGPFTASYGQLMTANGVAIDPGTDQAGTVVKLILADFGYGGEVTPQFPIIFITGSYTWDDQAQTATIVPYQSVDQSLTGLLSMENTILTPVTVASA